MKNFSLSIQRFAYFLIVLVLLFYIFQQGKSILVPLFFGAFFSVLLKPICNIFENLLKSRVAAILLSFLIALLPVLSIIGFFAYQIVNVVGNVSSLGLKLEKGFYNGLHWLGSSLGWSAEKTEQWVTDNINNLLDAPIRFISEGLSSTSGILVGITLTLIFTFFFLLYRTALKNFLIYQFDDHLRERALDTISRIEKVGRKYVAGLFYVMLILGVFNSLGLWMIGIRYAFFWGFLGAFLAIIPYVGTTLGGLFPLLFSLATGTTFWQPVAVVAWYAMVQALEGYIITPKIVGGSVKINPFAAILALLLGGFLWGVAGLILALPIMAVLRIIFLEIDVLKPVGMLLCEDLSEKTEVFENKFNENRFRLLSFFRKSR